MELGMPEFLRVLPEKYLKFGPDLSSSHWRQSFRDPSGLLKGSSVMYAFMQTRKHSSLVFLMLYSHTCEHISEKPSFLRQLTVYESPEIKFYKEGVRYTLKKRQTQSIYIL